MVKSVKQKVSNSRTKQIDELDETTSKIGFIQCTNVLRQLQTSRSIKCMSHIMKLSFFVLDISKCTFFLALNQAVAHSPGLMDLVDSVADAQFKAAELIGHYYTSEVSFDPQFLVSSLVFKPQNRTEIISGLKECAQELNKITAHYETEVIPITSRLFFLISSEPLAKVMFTFF